MYLRIYMYVYYYVYTCTWQCVYVHVCTCINKVHVQTCMYIRTLCTHMYIQGTDVHVRTYIHMCIHVHVHVCTHVCIYKVQTYTLHVVHVCTCIYKVQSYMWPAKFCRFHQNWDFIFTYSIYVYTCKMSWVASLLSMSIYNCIVSELQCFVKQPLILPLLRAVKYMYHCMHTHNSQNVGFSKTWSHVHMLYIRTCIYVHILWIIHIYICIIYMYLFISNPWVSTFMVYSHNNEWAIHVLYTLPRSHWVGTYV